VKEGEPFAETFVRGYGVPGFFRDWLGRLPGREGWYCYVASDGDSPAAAGALYAAGAVGWLGIAATVPEHRRKGAQNALLAARIEAAQAAGCEVLSTETGEPRDEEPGGSWRNIARSGFEPQYVRPNYLSSAS
jgi:GNAT superfamily N-acetyltransferase